MSLGASGVGLVKHFFGRFGLDLSCYSEGDEIAVSSLMSMHLSTGSPEVASEGGQKRS